MRGLVSSGTCFLVRGVVAQKRSGLAGGRRRKRLGHDRFRARRDAESDRARAPLVGEVDPLRCGRAPGASTYIRQLRYGLPQSCMHSTDDRGDGFTLFAGARNANRILDYPSPRLWSPMQGSKARRCPLFLCGGASWFGPGNDDALGNESGLDIAPETDCELAGQGDQHDRRMRPDWPVVFWRYQFESGLAG